MLAKEASRINKSMAYRGVGPWRAPCHINPERGIQSGAAGLIIPIDIKGPYKKKVHKSGADKEHSVHSLGTLKVHDQPLEYVVQRCTYSLHIVVRVQNNNTYLLLL